MLSVVVQHGDSLAVHIPFELRFMEPQQSVNVERVGDSLVISPIKVQSLADVMAIFSEFSDHYMADERVLHEVV